jgi:DNA-binding NarL/FixJ family response regulator
LFNGFFLCAMNCRIVLIESHSHLRNGLFLLLSAMPKIECLATFPNAASALAALPELQPDVVLTALDLPDAPDVADFLHHLSSQAAPVLILTTTESDELLAHCLESGAMGCIPKGASPEGLQRMILNLGSDYTEISAHTAQLLLQNFTRLLPKRGDAFAVLHDAEMRLLDLFARGYTTTDIAEHLMITQQDVNARTFALLRRVQEIHRGLPHVPFLTPNFSPNISIRTPVLYREKAA